MTEIVLITGANGFVGTAACRRFQEKYTVRAAVRTAERARGLPEGIESAVVGDIGPNTNWDTAVKGVDTVVHLASRAHVMRESAAEADKNYQIVNVEGTRALAAACARAQVRRIVYLSSIKALGESTPEDAPFTEESEPRPEDAYGRSKLAAEELLRQTASGYGIELVIVRPPLIHGPGVKGNLRQLLGFIYRGIPLPLGCSRNRRSLAGLDNLVDFLLLSVESPAAAGETFLLSDGDDLSTPELIKRLAGAMGRPARLVGVPESLMRVVGTGLGKRDMVNRLFGSLAVNSEKARTLTGWQQPRTLDEGLAQMAAWYLSERS